MKSKFILSSAFIMTTMGAFGADAKITEASTCTVDVLGVSDNNAIANTIATWALNEYTLNPGEYLNVTETDVAAATCPSGSYCVGGMGFTVDNADSSIAQCPTTHPNSAEGAGTDTQCYTACTVDMVAKATKVTGNDYYGTGTDTCEPTACVAGWHIESSLVEYINTNPVSVHYKSNSDVYYSNTGDFNLNKGEWLVVLQEGYLLKGQALCSSTQGVKDVVIGTPDEINIGDYCWCKLIEFSTPYTRYSISSSYVFTERSTCESCANHCANYRQYGSDFYKLLVDTTVGGPATCVANTINIDWNPDNGGEHTINQCTYEGEITLPTPDPVKPGYTFTGWKLVE